MGNGEPRSAAITGPIIGLAGDLLVCLRFYSRLPLPSAAPDAGGDPMARFARASRLAPLAGAGIGAAGAAALLVAGALLGLTSLIAAAAAVMVLIVCTGALHEDGLADVADGFGGGATRERKLEIMRDSRIGTFGALALSVSVLMRVAALSSLGDRHGFGAAALCLVAAQASSRGFGLLPLALLPPARADGLARGVGGLPQSTLPTALVLATVLGVLGPALAGIGAARALFACATAALASLAIVHLARRQIGGHTGDVSGAAQQLSDIAFLMALLVLPSQG